MIFFMRIFVLVFMASLFLPVHVWAAQDALPPLPRQAALIKGLQVIDQGQWKVGETFIAKAAGGFAGRTFYWMKYSSDKGAEGSDWYRVSRFVKSHKHWPDLVSMQKNAEKVMPDNLSSTQIVKWFDEFPPVSEQGRNRYLKALQASGQETALRRVLSEYWVETLFGSSEQSRILNQYAGFLSKPSHKKRFNFLLAHGYYDTAIALSSQIGGGYKNLGIAAKALSKSQKNVSSLIQTIPKSLQNHPALIYERIVWRRKNNLNQGAMDLLKRAPVITDEMNDYAWWKERHILIRRLIEEKNYQQAYHLASHHKQKSGLGLAEAEFMAGWLALRFVNKPHQAYQHFQSLYRNVKTPISKSRGAYWAGRAAFTNGRDDMALKWFKNASYWHTTYYGQHAYKTLQEMQKGRGEPLTIKRPAPIVISDEVWSKWTNDDRVSVMRLLFQAGLQDRALQFLARMLNDKGNRAEDFMALGKIVHIMGFSMGEVKVAKKAAYNSIILVTENSSILGYPALSVEDKHDEIGLSHVHAIIRQESEFNQEAKSSAGAMGFMQLMPATAKTTARKLKVSHRKNWLILRPEHNVLLGGEYLNSLMAQYDGSLIMSAAAYNAGPGRVKKWVDMFGDPRSPEVNALDWVELIPFSETRNYVQRVSEAEKIYGKIIFR